MSQPIIRSAFHSPRDEYNGRGIRPVVIDILGPDRSTSILPDGLKMVLHVNPSSMKFSYTSIVARMQTKGGYVEQHWGGGSYTINFELATGGFMRLYSGLSNITGGPGAINAGGTRRDSIAYDKYLDLLAAFHNNGRIYDLNGDIVFQGIIKISFDGHAWFGWFNNFQVSEAADKPYQFLLSTAFTVDSENLPLRTMVGQTADLRRSSTSSDFLSNAIGATQNFFENVPSVDLEPEEQGPSTQGFEP